MWGEARKTVRDQNGKGLNSKDFEQCMYQSLYPLIRTDVKPEKNILVSSVKFWACEGNSKALSGELKSKSGEQIKLLHKIL